MKREEKAGSRYLRYLLLCGIFASSLLLLWGQIQFLLHRGEDTVSYSVFNERIANVKTVFGVFESFTDDSSVALMLLGLVLLIFIPLLRVLFCGILFIFEKKPLYVLLSIALLALLVYSLLVERINISS